MYCKVCNKIIADDTTFCCFCGSTVSKESNTQRLFCVNCNREYDSTFPFCGTCGTKLIPINNTTPVKIPNEIKISNTFTIPDYGMVLLGAVVNGEIKTGDVLKTDTACHKILRMESLGKEITVASKSNAIAILIDNCTSDISIGSIVVCEDAPAIREPEPTTESTEKSDEVIITPPATENISQPTPEEERTEVSAPVSEPTAAETTQAEKANDTAPAFAVTFPEVYEDDAPEYDSSDAIMLINATSVYSGTKAVGAEILSGTIYIFADRIDTKSNLSNTLTPFIKMSDIQSVAKSKYMHMWSSIVIYLKNGDAYTLASASAGSAAIDRALQIISRSITN